MPPETKGTDQGAAADSAQKGTIPAAAIEDRSQFIRTMAKDMAALSGTKLPAPAPVVASPAPPKTIETVDGVSMPVADAYLEQQQAKRDEIQPEVLDLPSVAEAGQIVGGELASEPRAIPIPVMPRPNTAASDSDRMAILERLRRKVGESADMSIQTSVERAPEPIVPPAVNEWPDIPVPAPAFQPAPGEPASINRMPPVSREPMVPPQPAAVPDSGLHTYTSDFAERIDTKGASAFSVLAAEQDSKHSMPRAIKISTKFPTRTVLTIGSGILLLVLAGGGVYATYQLVMNKNVAPSVPLAVPTIVFADEYKELSGRGPDLLGALAGVSDGGVVAGNVLVTYVTESVSDTKGIPLRKPAAGGVLIEALELPAPDILLRNIASESTVGVISAGETRPFFALRVDSYERTYAGMLTWEPLMERDLASLYPLFPAETVVVPVPAVSTSTPQASTTPTTQPISVQAQAQTRFSDAVVANRDVRVLKDTSGRSLILYGYADKGTLLIARNEAAFEALLQRLKTSK
ncbi:MAG: hypothetical protein AB199_00495 [Parcubacteria bacterium C7867-004]|nr:MAG: hypothetical protein AB199_00495 [Parcubacteria bacterium C7867-004]